MDVIGILPFFIIIMFVIFFIFGGIIFFVIWFFIISKMLTHRKEIEKLAKELNLNVSQTIPFFSEPELNGNYKGRKLRLFYEKTLLLSGGAGRGGGELVNVEVKLRKNIKYEIIIEDRGYFQSPSIKTGNLKFDNSWVINTKYSMFKEIIDSSLQNKILKMNIPKNQGAEFNIFDGSVKFKILYGNLNSKKLKDIINLLCFIADRIDK